MNTIRTTNRPFFSNTDNSTIQFSPNNRVYKWVIGACIFLGIVFRVFHFFYNRSLWNDEMYLSSSLVKMNFWDLATKPLDYEQKAPLGFLWSVKLCVQLFGNSEMALRLFPLLCSLGSLFLTIPVARYFLRPLGVAIIVGTIALSPYTIYHAVEIKQYSTELLATTFLLFLYCRYHDKTNYTGLLLYGFLGALTVWFSFSAIYILVGIGAGTCLYLALKKKWAHLFRCLIPFSIWAVSFGISYLLFVKNHPAKEWLVEWFALSHGFMPMPPTSITDLGWFVHKLFGSFHYPLGLSWATLPPEHNALVRLLVRNAIVPLILLAAGLFAFWRDAKKHLLILSLPFVLHLLASGVQAYPFLERLTFYLAPIMALVIAKGSQKVGESFSAKKLISYLLVFLVLFGPLLNDVRQVINPGLFGDFKKSYDREALLYINKHFKQGDVVYVYWNNLVPYRYYKENYKLQFNAIEGSDYRFTATNLEQYMQQVEKEISQLKSYKRVWLIYNTILPNGNIGDRMYDPEWYFKSGIHVPKEKLHPLFARFGKQIDYLETRNVNVALFQFEE